VSNRYLRAGTIGNRRASNQSQQWILENFEEETDFPGEV